MRENWLLIITMLHVYFTTQATPVSTIKEFTLRGPTLVIGITWINYSLGNYFEIPNKYLTRM